MKPFYVIVHRRSIGVRDEVQREILRIQQEEEWVAVDGDERIIPSDVPRDRPIYVCGAYLELCVRDQCDALLRADYQAAIWNKGTVSL